MRSNVHKKSQKPTRNSTSALGRACLCSGCQNAGTAAQGFQGVSLSGDTPSPAGHAPVSLDTGDPAMARCSPKGLGRGAEVRGVRTAPPGLLLLPGLPQPCPGLLGDPSPAQGPVPGLRCDPSPAQPTQPILGLRSGCPAQPSSGSCRARERGSGRKSKFEKTRENSRSVRQHSNAGVSRER